MKKKIIRHGPNYLAIDATTGTGSVRVKTQHVTNEQVAILTEALEAKAHTAVWTETILSHEDAVNVARDILGHVAIAQKTTLTALLHNLTAVK